MRVLYLTDTYRPARTACANRSVVIVEALRSVGHYVQVLASTDSLIGAPEDFELPEGTVFFKTFPLVEKTLVSRLKNNFGGRWESVKVAETMGAFDVVMFTTPPLLLATSAIEVAKRKNAKLVLDVRDIWPDVAYEMGSFSPGSIYGCFFERIAKKAYRAASCVITVSPGKVAKLECRVPRGRVELLSNGVDETFLENSEDLDLARSLHLNEGPVCVYVGNIGLAQGLATLLDIAKKRPAVRFLLFGEGADRRQLEKRALEEGLDNVEFCGIVGERGVYTVLQRATLSYVPLVSSRLRDSIPTKMYEALTCGCPVLLAAEGDAASLLDETGLGMHAAPENFEALLAAFDRIVTDGYSDAQRVAVSRYMLKNYSRQTLAESFAKSFEAKLAGNDAR